MTDPQRRCVVALAVAACVLFGASAGSATRTHVGRGADGTLRLYYWQAPTILNPHLSPGSKDLSASRITYEPLATVDARGRLIPLLAAEIPSLQNGEVARDGRSVTWKLRPGVRWSDGKPFTAEDVKFTFEYVTNPAVKSSSASNYASVARVVAVNPTTVRVIFKDVNPAWAVPFVGAQGCILPKHVFAAYNGSKALDAPANLKPVGTGPYRVVEFSKEDVIIVGGVSVATTRTRYEANPYYRDKAKPAFSTVDLEGGGGSAVTAAQIIGQGLGDFAWNVQVSDAVADSVRNSGKGRLVRPLGSFVERIMLNFTDPNHATPDGERSSTRFPHPFLSDKRVRQAITLAVDR
jgi:peptide/nickel transport system substrate-binding protein